MTAATRSEDAVPQDAPELVAGLRRLGNTRNEEVLKRIGVSAIKAEAFRFASGVDVCREGAAWSWICVVVPSVAEMGAAAGCGDVGWTSYNAPLIDVAFVGTLCAESIVGCTRRKATLCAGICAGGGICRR